MKFFVLIILLSFTVGVTSQLYQHKCCGGDCHEKCCEDIVCSKCNKPVSLISTVVFVRSFEKIVFYNFEEKFSGISVNQLDPPPRV